MRLLRSAPGLLFVSTLTLGAAAQTAPTEPPPPDATASPMPAANPDATPEQLEAARFFHQGAAAYDAGKYQEAWEAWQNAWSLHRTFDIAGNLAQVEIRLGKRRDAAEHLTYALRNFPPSAKAATRAEMEARLDALRKDVPSVRVRVNVPEAEVLVDGRVVGRAPLSDVLYVDPGKHVISARHSGHTEAQQAVQLAAGNTQDVELILTPVPADTSLPPDEGRPLNKGLLIGGIALAAAGLVTGVVGTVVSASAAGDESDLQGPLDDQGISSCLLPQNQTACVDRDDARDRKRTFRGVAIAGFGVGGAAAIATVVYVATRTKPRPAPAIEGKRLTPNAWLGPRGGAVGVSGRF